MGKYAKEELLSLDELIKKEMGEDEGINVYNYICEEVRRMDGFVNGNMVLRGDYSAYKMLFYECYKVIKKYLDDTGAKPEFNWQRYGAVIKLIQKEEYIRLKLKVKDKICASINSTIDNFYEKHKKTLQNTSVPFTFSVITYNVLKGISKEDFKILSQKSENDYFV